MQSKEPSVVAVCMDARHGFSKPRVRTVELKAGIGIVGDAHAGATVKHRYLARFRPREPNLRQVHLMDASLFDELSAKGFTLVSGALGENITTAGVDLVRLPLGTRLRLGHNAAIELTGLRTPCVLIERFQKGLLAKLKQPGMSPPHRCGVMAVAIADGIVQPGDRITVELPPHPHRLLPAI